MNRRRAAVCGPLILAVALAGGYVSWGQPATEPRGHSFGWSSNVGVAGPLGPQAFSAVSSYVKRVTFANDQLGLSQEISARLPAGRYLVRVMTPGARAGSEPDCLGVSFPLAPPAEAGDAAAGFAGYVSLARSGDAATVSCSEKASGPQSTATFEVFYIPAAIS